jgi:hypothetical protein
MGETMRKNLAFQRESLLHRASLDRLTVTKSESQPSEREYLAELHLGDSELCLLSVV